MDRFKNRYGIVHRHISGEVAVANTEDVDSLTTSVLPKIAKIYIGCDIFNVVKCGRLFKVINNFLIKHSQGKYTGENLRKDRVLVRRNSDGIKKIKLHVTDKSRNLRSFEKNEELAL